MLKKIGFEKLLRIMSMFASSYLYEQVFSGMKLQKSNVRNRLTDGHLASLLRVTTSQPEPEYENYWTLDRSSTCHTLHYTKEQNKHQVCRNQGKLKYFIIFSLFHYYFS
jgi:hypothetical protein